MHNSIELSQAECETLLRSRVVGRLAVSTPSGPHIIPINYSVVDDAIIIRTSPYSVLGTYGRESTLAFEVDQFDHEHHSGWSVVARGPARFVTDPDELDHIRALSRPHPWAAGTREMHLRLTWDELSGRRLGVPSDPVTHLYDQGTR
ncbi:MAG: pyridoxamine 5'-phosphate oxidase family protein [Nocardioides sp.]|nr:pyridoxamine 5'-phosphate oxidase family protein [Nocardioides sp.]